MPDESERQPNQEPAETKAMLPADGGPGESEAVRVVQVLDDYMASLKAGATPHRSELLAAHPDLASQLEACLAGLEFIHATGQLSPSPRRLGDFEILREIGQGGMGAV